MEYLERQKIIPDWMKFMLFAGQWELQYSLLLAAECQQLEDSEKAKSCQLQIALAQHCKY